MNRQIPKPFGRYRHFKGKEYQIICIAKDAETLEDIVVYQALYGECLCYTRPLSMFLSEVDHEKYPDVEQKYRFQEIDGTEGSVQEKSVKKSQGKSNRRLEIPEPKPGEADPALLAFLDADTIAEKSNVLVSVRHRITDRLIDDMAVTLDVVIPEGDVDTRYQQLLSSIKTMQRYETERLR